MTRAAILATIALFALGCGGGSKGTPAPTAPSNPTSPTPTPAPTVSITGTVTDRISGGPIDGSTIKFTSLTDSKSALVVNGSYSIDLVPRQYDVTITGPANVPHETQSLTVTAAGTFPFSVLKWGSGRFGAIYDQNFDKFFDQLTRVGSGGVDAIRKWVIPPTQIYVAVENTVPSDELADVVAALQEIDVESVSALWCGLTGPLSIVTGPDITKPQDGMILVRPNFSDGSSGTLGEGDIKSGTVTVNVFRPGDDRYETHLEMKGILLHELYHVAFGFHVCGGPLGDNPFGFSPTICLYPESVMADLGDGPTVLAPQDKLAACIVYHPDTHIGNFYDDINPTYR